ncbi:Uncharacterized protein HA466_0088900 [Hirschfeldia incana]|nr:Uncharacterized protein HA466_0088900 [Hirschfeldia incana]
MGKRRFQGEKEPSATVGEASSLLESQTTRRRRGRPRKNLESPENFKKEEDEDYEEYEDEEDEEEEQVEMINREKQKKKVRSSPSVEEGQKWNREELAEEEEKPDMMVKTVTPLSYRRSKRKNTPVKSW